MSNVLKLFKRNSVTLKNIWIIYTTPNNSTFVKIKMQASKKSKKSNLLLDVLLNDELSNPQQHRGSERPCVKSLQTRAEDAV